MGGDGLGSGLFPKDDAFGGGQVADVAAGGCNIVTIGHNRT